MKELSIGDKELPFRLGEHIKNKKSGISYCINGFGRNRATRERYFILETIILYYGKKTGTNTIKCCDYGLRKIT